MLFAMLAILGSALTLAGMIWIAVIAFRNEDTVWGIFSIFCCPAALIYGIQHMGEAGLPLGLLVVGALIQGGAQVGLASVNQ